MSPEVLLAVYVIYKLPALAFGLVFVAGIAAIPGAMLEAERRCDE